MPLTVDNAALDLRPLTRSNAAQAGVIGSGRMQPATMVPGEPPPLSLGGTPQHDNTPLPSDLLFQTPTKDLQSGQSPPLLPLSDPQPPPALPASALPPSVSSSEMPTPVLGPNAPPVPKWLTDRKGSSDTTPPSFPAGVDPWAWKPNAEAQTFVPNFGPGSLDKFFLGDSDSTPSHLSNERLGAPSAEQMEAWMYDEHAQWMNANGEFDDWGEWIGDGYYTYDQYGRQMQMRRRKPRPDPKVRAEQKVFVGGLSAHTTAKKLEAYFAKFGNVLNASILTDAQSCRSRGFGFITFGGRVPDCVVGIDHMIDGRLCGARLYNPQGTKPGRM